MLRDYKGEINGWWVDINRTVKNEFESLTDTNILIVSLNDPEVIPVDRH